MDMYGGPGGGGGASEDPAPTSSTYVAPDGTIKKLQPHNVNINQFYPQVAFSAPKQRSAAKLGEFVEAPLAITDGKEKKNAEEDAEQSTSQSGDKQEESADEAKKAAEAGGEGEEGVFSTQVDEDTLAAAQQRQQQQQQQQQQAGGGGLFEPEKWESSNQTTTMAMLLEEKVQSHLKRAETLAAGGQQREAITQYNKAIQLRPREKAYYAQRAECYLQLADFQSAIVNYKRACVLAPDHFRWYCRLAFLYYLHGQCLFDQKLFPEALEAFSRAAEMRPEVVGYHTRSIACLAALQRHGECLALVNKRLETEHANPDLYVMRARLHQLFRNTTLCYYDVKDALGLSAGHAEAERLMAELEERAEQLKQQAVSLHLATRHRDALHKVTLAVETNPSVADFHILRGALQRRLGDFNAAIDDYLLALDKTEHDEEHPVYVEAQRQLLLTYNDFAIECFSKGFFEEAIILLNKAIKGEKTERGLYINRGDCFYKEGSLQFALADYQQALEMEPTDPAIQARIAVVHNDYGLQEYNAKNYKESEKRLSLAIQHNPRVAEYYLSRGRVRHLLESGNAARQDVLLALHLDAQHPELLSVLTRVFPGKSVRDVLASPAAARLKQQLPHLVPTASPVSLTPIQQSEAGAAAAADEGAGKPSAAWKPGGVIPGLRSCMQDKEFNIQVAKERQKVNERVKAALCERGSLRSHLSGVKVAPPPGPPPGLKKGWRKFTQGVS